MRILFRRFWWFALLTIVATALIAQQMLIKNTFVLAQNTTSSPTTYPATWIDFTVAQKPHPDAESACKAYEGSSGDAKVIFNHLELYNFQGTNTVAGATCYLDIFNKGLLTEQYSNLVSVGCLKNGQNDYDAVYTGGKYGYCRLSSLSQSPFPCADNRIQTNYNKNNPNYHFYDFKNKICSKQEYYKLCTKEKIFSLMVSQERFIAPTDDKNPVISCVEKKLLSLPEQENKIKTVINEDDYSITNYTLPGHIFYPGKVIRKVIDDGSSISVQTTGDGTGDLPSFNKWASRDIWDGADTRLLVEFKLGK